MKIVSVANLKGGTGKTSFAFNFAGILAESEKVLLLDGDPQSNLSESAGVDIGDRETPSMRNILDPDDNTPIDKIIIKNPIEELPNLDIIPASIDLFQTENRLFTVPSREQRLAHYFSDNLETISEYDYILCDTHPSMGLINQNIFNVSDSIILLSDGSMHSIRGIQLFQYMWADICKNLRIENTINALILSGFDKRSSIYAQAQEYCQDDEELGNLLIETTIPTDTNIQRTVVFHKPINIYAGNKSKSTEALRNIQKELLVKGVL